MMKQDIKINNFNEISNNFIIQIQQSRKSFLKQEDLSSIHFQISTYNYKIINNNNKIMQNKPISIDMPQIYSLKYKSNVKEIEQSVKQLNSFTNNLQGKVSMMLKGQQTQFVNSYKNHMNNIQKALQNYENKMMEYQKKIQHYENEGALSTLLKRINFLQQQQRKLLKTIEKKDETIFELKTQIGLLESEINSLKIKIKELMHFKIERSNRTQYQKIKEKQAERTFATQINLVDRSALKSNQSQLKNYETMLDYSLEQNQQANNLKKDKQINRINRELSHLKKKNREMSSVTSRMIQKTSQINQFFLRTVEDLKKKILMRKQFKECTFEDFKQEDKLQLMIRVLSNEEILKHLYEKLFRKPTTSVLSQHSTKLYDHSKEKLDLKYSQNLQTSNKLPAIYSQRRAQFDKI